MTKHVLGCCALIVLASCRETRVAPNAVPVVEHDSSEVSLVVSDSAPPAGSVVRVAALLRLAADSAGVVGSGGSYTARLRFDSTALRYVGDEPVADAALRATNGKPGELRVAGAAVKGFTTGVLFAARFEVRQPGGLASFRLSFDELHDRAVRDIRSRVRVARRVVPEMR